MTSVLPHPTKMELSENNTYFVPSSNRVYTKMDITLSLIHQTVIEGVTGNILHIDDVNDISLGEFSYIIRYNNWKKVLIIPSREVVSIDCTNK